MGGWNSTKEINKGRYWVEGGAVGSGVECGPNCTLTYAIGGIYMGSGRSPMVLEHYLTSCISTGYIAKWGRRSSQVLMAQGLTLNWTYISDFQVRRGGGGRRFLLFKWLLHKGLGGGILELLPQRRED